MAAVLKAAGLYFAIAFACGFGLGTVRTLVLEPLLGDLVAVLIELPFILTAAVLACGWVVRRFGLAGSLGGRFALGLVAFVLLQAAEQLLAWALGSRGGPLTAFAATATTAQQVGLAAQIAFGLLPLFIPRRSSNV